MGGPPRHDFGKGLVYPSQNVLVNLPHSAGQGAFIITGKGPEVAAYPDDFRMCPTKHPKRASPQSRTNPKETSQRRLATNNVNLVAVDSLSVMACLGRRAPSEPRGPANTSGEADSETTRESQPVHSC
jgi:hypothetical protein